MKFTTVNTIAIKLAIYQIRSYYLQMNQILQTRKCIITKLR